MPIDPTSTEPGLVAEKPALKEVMITCAHGCGNKMANEVSANNVGQMSRIYQCTGCKATWSVPMGTAFNF